MIKVAFVFCTILISVFASPASNRKVIDNLGWRVVGGSNAPDGDYPYQISLRDSDDRHACGGSIINNTIIVTAAHCVVGTSPKSVTVVVGSNKLDDGGTTYQVKDLRSHNDYNPFTIENDIAIVKLATPIEYNSKVSPIELEDSEIGEDIDAVLSGWGTTSFPGSTPNDLQHITLKTVSNSDCQAKHGSLNTIYDTQICTFTQRGEGACHGDSGGPLRCESGKLCGIVSWGRPCGVGYPDVFTRVSSYLDWIKIHSY